MGKSWFLIECGKQGILHHKKVLHISLEMTEDQVSQRYVQSILSMTEDQVDSLEINHILKSETGEFLNFTKKQISPEHLAPENRVHLTNLLRFLERRPPFRIEAYPSGTLTVSHLDMQLDLLEQEYDFRPDLVLIDYPRIMAQDADNLRISLGQTMVDLRGQAQARDYALVAVAQSNRQASTAKIIHGNMVAEDYSLMMTADKALTYMRTEEEALQNRARVFVEKGRTRRDKFTVAVTQNYEIGQFCLDSVRFPAKAEKELERIKQEEAAHQ
jgi:replicative DNA helicase